MREGLVSVIVPVFNRPHALREAIASVQAQIYPRWEILVVDDGSTDETPRVADELAAVDPARIRVAHRVNGGPGAARESGRQLAMGEFLQYLDSDDLLAPRKLELQVRALRENPRSAVAYGATLETRGDGFVDPSPIRPSNEPIDRMFPMFLRLRWWNTVSPLYRRSVAEEVGAWSRLWLEEDWEYDARVAALGRPVVFVGEVVGQARDLNGERLSRGAARDRARLEQRATAHRSILQSARKAGVPPSAPEMRRFARELFLLARQCGEVGLARESKELFLLSRAASLPGAADGLDFRLYRLAAAVLGWSGAARLAGAWEMFGSDRAGRDSPRTGVSRC